MLDYKTDPNLFVREAGIVIGAEASTKLDDYVM